MMLDEIFGDCVHQNPGQHLSQGVPEDADWQDCWRRLVVFPSQTCDLSKGKVGRLFLEMLATQWMEFSLGNGAPSVQSFSNW